MDSGRGVGFVSHERLGSISQSRSDVLSCSYPGLGTAAWDTDRAGSLSAFFKRHLAQRSLTRRDRRHHGRRHTLRQDDAISGFGCQRSLPWCGAHHRCWSGWVIIGRTRSFASARRLRRHNFLLALSVALAAGRISRSLRRTCAGSFSQIGQARCAWRILRRRNALVAFCRAAVPGEPQ